MKSKDIYKKYKRDFYQWDWRPTRLVPITRLREIFYKLNRVANDLASISADSIFYSRIKILLRKYVMAVIGFERWLVKDMARAFYFLYVMIDVLKDCMYWVWLEVKGK